MKPWSLSTKFRFEPGPLATPCKVWTGDRTAKGYGRVRRGNPGEKHVYRVHRVAWMLKNGPIPPGYYIAHHCDNPPCYADDHLWLATPTENVRDMYQKGRWKKKPRCVR